MKKRLIVLTGAGMSAESGIATFRDSGGLWEQHRVEDVATAEALHNNLEVVLKFYANRLKQLRAAKPNAGHIALAEMEKEYNISIVTQNVDDLHERAGSSHVVHLHGELTKMRSIVDDSLIYDIPPEKDGIKIGDKCEKGYQLRPHIVLFGEAVPMIREAASLVREADIFLIIGTSMNVYPAAGLLDIAPHDIPVYLIDPKAVNTGYRKVIHIQKGASEGIKEFQRAISS